MSSRSAPAAAGAPRLHRDRQPGAAVHGRGRLQRRRPRPADRDDGRQPGHRRADQHLERPLATPWRCGTAAGSSSTRQDNQEAVDLHVQAFRLAEELSLPVMVCMDGFVLTHAFERLDLPSQEQVDAFLPPYEPRQLLDPADAGDDRRDGRTGGVHRGAVPRPRQAAAGARRDSRRSPRSSPSAFRPRLRAAWSARTDCDGRRDRRGRARLGARHARRRSSTTCATRACRSARSASRPSGRSRWTAVRAALAGAREVVVIERALAVGHRRDRRRRTCGWRWRASARRAHGDRRPRRPGDHPGLARPTARRRPGRPARAASTSSTSTEPSSASSTGRWRPRRAARREHAADLGTVASRIG